MRQVVSYTLFVTPRRTPGPAGVSFLRTKFEIYCAAKKLPRRGDQSVSSGAYKSEGSTMQELGSATQWIPTQVRVERILSNGRFETFLKSSNGDFDKALRLYVWNIAISSAFWGSFHLLEVSPRNVLHAELVKSSKRDDWWNSDVRRKDLHRALEQLRKLRNRIAHHEPIYDRILEDDLKLIEWIIGLADYEIGEWSSERSQVSRLLGERNRRIEGSLPGTF